MTIVSKTLESTSMIPAEQDCRWLTEAGLRELTDKSLLRRFRTGHEDAATALYMRYAKRLLKLAQTKSSPEVAVRIDPEGIVQSVFRTFFRRVSKGQYDVIEGQRLWNLFLVIALNKIRSSAARHRTAKRDVARTLGSGEAAFAALPSHRHEGTALTILSMTIKEILESMNADQRIAMQLRIEGFSVETIAKKMNRAKRSVERLLQNARRSLDAAVLREFP